MQLSISALTTLAFVTLAQGMVIPSVEPIKRDQTANSTIASPPVPKARLIMAPSDVAVANKYIVVMKSNISSTAFQAHKKSVQSIHSTSLATSQKAFAASSEGSGIVSEFDIDNYMKGYTGYFTEDTIKSLQQLSEVEFIEQDATVKTFESAKQTNATWGISRISSKKSLNGATTGTYLYDDEAGEGVTAFIIDTGVNVKHEEFQGRASWGKTFPTDGDQDGVGHGTHCAGTVAGKTYGVAKKADIVAVKVLGNDGSGTNSDVINGIQWAAAQHKNNVATKSGYKGSTANMSLGGGKSTAVNNAASAAVKAGLMLAVAAGNENQDACNTSPASCPDVITVAASNNKDARAYFSNYGECVDIFGPGVDILSAWIGSTTATNTISGTSMATPHITGLLTYFLSLAPASDSEFSSTSSSLTLEQIKKAIVAFGTQDVISDVQGTPNVLAYNGAGGDLSKFWKFV